MPPDDTLTDWMRSQAWPDLRDDFLTTSVGAYVHPYGFIVARLPFDYFPAFGIRLHIWPSCEEFDHWGARTGSADQMIHSHGWVIYTRTLIGAVEQAAFSVSVTPSGEYCSYGVHSDRGVGESRLTHDRCHLAASCTHVETNSVTDGILRIPKGEFHTTRPARDGLMSLTLAATEHSNSNTSRILSNGHRRRGWVNMRGTVSSVEHRVEQLDAQYRQENAGEDEWAAFVFLTRGRQVLLVRTYRNPRLWQPVGGQSRKADGSPISTAIREVKEETGIQLDKSSLKPLGEYPRDKGAGLVYAWTTPIPHEPTFQKEELAETCWFDLADAISLPTFAAAKKFLHSLAEDPS